MSNINSWEKLKVITTVVGTIFIPIVLLIISSNISAALKDKETRAKYLELAINILMNETHPSNYKIRDWAVNVINHYSEVPLPKQTQEELVKDFRIVGKLVQINDKAQYEWLPTIVDKHWKDKKFIDEWNRVVKNGDLQEQKKLIKQFISNVESEILTLRNQEYNKLGIMTWPPYWSQEHKP